MWLVSTGTIPGNLPFRLDPGKFVVGRSRKAQIVIRDLTVSKQHARLVCTARSVVVEDLGSRNGTFVNEEPAGPTTAEQGSTLRFGSVVCMLSATAMMPVQSVDSESTFAVGGLASPTLEIGGLTPAQREVLALALRGADEAAIAHTLGRSWHTVHTHLKAIFKHFGVHTRAELVARLLAPQKGS
ncbi:MAG TPA: FHA domain-containing protein [Pirellulaceae bacterium]|jgi:DNA-binding CsgD family transcriptional regulator|nr:FHA domain-containing protein [Pirellulaceae bacterium]